jgi:energy-converting hydrogenase Eha subunit A
MNLLKAIVLGFIAGAIATLTVHEIISAIFHNPNVWTGWPRQSWNLEPAEMTGVPQIISDMFWGGLWGALFGLILGSRPQGSMTVRGAILGIVGPALIGVFLAVPLLTQKFPVFFDGDPSKIIPVLVILAGFGAATAWLYGMFRYGRLP